MITMMRKCRRKQAKRSGFGRTARLLDKQRKFLLLQKRQNGFYISHARGGNFYGHVRVSPSDTLRRVRDRDLVCLDVQLRGRGGPRTHGAIRRQITLLLVTDSGLEMQFLSIVEMAIRAAQKLFKRLFPVSTLLFQGMVFAWFLFYSQDELVNVRVSRG